MTTPKEFDYDLWKTAEGVFFTRIKRTGEICEVDAEVFRTLHNDAMKMHREQQGIPSYTVRNGKSVLVGRSSLLHIEYESDNENGGAVQVADITNLEDDYVFTQQELALRDSLTPKQLDIYLTCMIGGMPAVEYARKLGIKPPSVAETMGFIRKKAKLFLDIP